MNYRLSVAVLVPSELLHAFDSNYEREFVAVREQGTIVLRPNISYEGTSCELMKTDYRRGYFAGMKEGYFQGYTDALECDEPANIDDNSNEKPHVKGNAADVRITTIFLIPAGTTFHNRRHTMGYNKGKRPDTDLCLCSQCASHFYNSPTHRIFRTDPLQVTKELCDHCRTHRGYDFIISIVRPVRKRNAESVILQSSNTTLEEYAWKSSSRVKKPHRF